MEIEQRDRERTEDVFEHVVEPPSIDPYMAMHLVRNDDGSLTRLPLFPTCPPVGQVEHPTARCFSKDVISDLNHNVRLRIYRPNPVPSETKLPILIFFHGGGFICFSPATAGYHVYAEEMACRLPAIVISVDYRLAPENPLPAAYDDAFDTVEWVRDEWAQEPWVRDYGDVSRCFLVGSSAGGNIVYHTALRTQKIDLGPVVIEGLIFIQPFFGGVLRTDSELRFANDMILPLPVTDLMWELSLPSGSQRDHVFCNPMTGTPSAEEMGNLPRSLVSSNLGDPLNDRQRDFAKMLEEKGVKVVTQFREGHHAAELLDAGAMEALVKDVKSFVSGFCK
ncbi:probable carboxylesterase 8 [Aristolochia californica]|uniref:probable carboxylesterase 8 n=1 Tax=Aristolochia californica TaxID=171875 RepID=UPI0035D765CB